MLIPRDKPFIDGLRYRETANADSRKLMLYEEDENGPLQRILGVLADIEALPPNKVATPDKKKHVGFW
jgi:hypothetical protein